MPVNNFDYSLTWSDFTVVTSRPTGSKNDAESNHHFSYSAKYARNGNAVVFSDVNVTISLVSRDCWVISKYRTSDLLKHEQGHYDIFALGARDFYNALLNLSATSTHELDTKLNDAETKIKREVKRVQARYDSQTKQSRKKRLQQIWDQKISVVKGNLNGTLNDLPQ